MPETAAIVLTRGALEPARSKAMEERVIPLAAFLAVPSVVGSFLLLSVLLYDGYGFLFLFRLHA